MSNSFQYALWEEEKNSGAKGEQQHDTNYHIKPVMFQESLVIERSKFNHQNTSHIKYYIILLFYYKYLHNQLSVTKKKSNIW